MNATTRLREAAHEYADAGIPVGPCEGKIPRTPNGFHDFTVDHEQIDRYWDRWPGANIGGCPLHVIDIDITDFDKHGKPKPNGLHQLIDIGQYEIPETLTVWTGSTNASGDRGMHLYFSPPQGMKWRGKLDGCSSIDIKTRDTGYVIMPPSVNPATGIAYEWFAPDADVAPVPDWVISRGQKHQPRTFTHRVKGRKATGLAATVLSELAATREGGRHDAIVGKAGYLASRGIFTENVDAFREAALATGQEPADVETAIRDALAWESRSFGGAA